MMSSLHFLIVDGYPEPSRKHFIKTGCKLAWQQYRDMLLAHMPEAGFDVLLASDPGAELPQGVSLSDYHGIMWTGCNLTIYQLDDPRVIRMIELAKKAYELGTSSYGSCWGLQIAAVAAGGQVKANPKGREMGLARKIYLTDKGKSHPFYSGKPPVFDGFISHYDEVTSLPAGATLLASNDFTWVQGICVTYQKGSFWAVQYHPEYDLHDMARLIVARKEKLLNEGFFYEEKELAYMVEQMQTLYRQPDRKDLRWQLGIDDDLLDSRIRQCEFANWLRHLVIPTANRKRGGALRM